MIVNGIEVNPKEFRIVQTDSGSKNLEVELEDSGLSILGSKDELLGLLSRLVKELGKFPILTEADKLKFMDEKGLLCPICEDETIEVLGIVQKEPGVLSVRCKCQECGLELDAIHTLTYVGQQLCCGYSDSEDTI